MKLNKLHLENYTVFDSLHITLATGINIFIGENGTGKSHLLKLLYAASRATDGKTAFAQKVVRLMLPDDYQLARLVRRGAKEAAVRIEDASGCYLSLHFDNATYKSLYKCGDVVCYEHGEGFDDLKHNVIVNSFDKLLDEIYDLEVSRHE